MECKIQFNSVLLMRPLLAHSVWLVDIDSPNVKHVNYCKFAALPNLENYITKQLGLWYLFLKN